MSGWVEIKPKPRRQHPADAYAVKIRQQNQRWLKLCLDKDLMYTAMLGCMRIRCWYEDGTTAGYWRARRQLYKWARVHAEVWGISLIGALYATLVCASCWKSAITLRSETGGEYIMTNWNKV